VKNARLALLSEPSLIDEEAIAARLYTGPLFVKYNSVLRGIKSDVPFLINQMLELCCAPPEYAACQAHASSPGGRGMTDSSPEASTAFERARAAMNTYTTTLHAVNSAIVKLSKLTYASKVYRGVAGRVLPEQFWNANEYGVRGGIEAAFMSTTVDRQTAMRYAHGGGGVGFVFEIQQGMVDRGADISFLSQYPHEREILFAPLAGFEVKYSRVEGNVLVVVVGLSVNLTAETIEQVVSKRRKLVSDMCDQLTVHSKQHAATSSDWSDLRSEPGALEAADTFMRSVRPAICGHEPAHYNVNFHLSGAIDDAIGVADMVDGWGKGLRELCDAWQAFEKERKSYRQLFVAQDFEMPPRYHLGCDAAYGVGALVSLSTSLQRLVLSNNQLTDVGVAAIGMALASARSSQLAALYLSNTGAGERAARAMVAVLQGETRLKTLDLRSNSNLDEDAKGRLHRAASSRPKFQLVI